MDLHECVLSEGLSPIPGSYITNPCWKLNNIITSVDKSVIFFSFRFSQEGILSVSLELSYKRPPHMGSLNSETLKECNLYISLLIAGPL